MEDINWWDFIYNVLLPMIVSVLTSIGTGILTNKWYFKFNQNKLLMSDNVPVILCYDIQNKQQLEDLNLKENISTFKVFRQMNLEHKVSVHFINEKFVFKEGMELHTIIVLENTGDKPIILKEVLCPPDEVVNLYGIEKIKVSGKSSIYLFVNTKEIPKHLVFACGNTLICSEYIVPERGFRLKIEPI